jgi:hypothetical protein
VESSKDRSQRKAQKKDRLQRKARKNFEVIPIHWRPMLSLLHGYLITRQNSKLLTALSTRKRIQNAQEAGKNETHQAPEFVVHQTDRRGAISFLVYVAMADFFFSALTPTRTFKYCAGRATTGTRKYNLNPKPHAKNRSVPNIFPRIQRFGCSTVSQY